MLTGAGLALGATLGTIGFLRIVLWQAVSPLYLYAVLAEAGYPDGRDARTGQPLVLYLDTDFDGCMKLVQEITRDPTLYLANSMNSVVQTGVKSAGCENRISQLPLKSSSRSVPCVVSAWKGGAG